MLISDAYKAQNIKLHKINPEYGKSSYVWAHEIDGIIDRMDDPTILDYGCGKGLLSKSLPHRFIQEYDPAIDGKDANPAPSDLVICTDVLEHIEPENLNDVLTHLHSVTTRKLFFNIAIRPSSKFLPDGRNSHLIVESPEWWQQKLESYFSITRWEVKTNYCVTGEASPLLRIDEVKTIVALSEEERNANVLANIKKIPLRLKEQSAHDRKAILVCYGPSLLNTYQSIFMSKLLGHDIVTVSGTHRFLLEKDIKPDIHIDCDPRRRKAIQFGRPEKGVKYWIGSSVDPLYLEILDGHDVTLWHLNNGQKSEEFIWNLEPDEGLIVGGGSVGLRAISVLYSQGYRDFEIHGMDCSFEDERERHAGMHLSPKQRILQVTCKGRKFLSTPSLISYAQQFNSDLRLWPNATFRLHGDGLLQHMQRSDA